MYLQAIAVHVSTFSNLLLQKATVFIGEPMDFTDQLNELRAAKKSDVSVKIHSHQRRNANAKISCALKLGLMPVSKCSLV